MADQVKDVKRIESATIAAVTTIDRQNAYESVSPYRMRHQFTGGTKIYYTSDTGDRTQDGDISITTGNYLETEKVQALKASGLVLADDSGTGYLTVNDGGTVDIDTDLLLAGGSQDYLVSERSNRLTFTGQTADTTSGIELFPYGPSGTADGTDDCFFIAYGVGSSASATNSERLVSGYDSGNTRFEIFSEQTGTGTLRPLVLYTEGNTNQLHLATDGDIGVGIAAGDGRFHVWSATAGSVTAHVDADELVLESDGNTGLSILCPDASTGSIYFGNPSNNDDGRITYLGTLDEMTFYTAGNERMSLGTGEVCVNEPGGDVDYRIESADKTNMFFLDAAINQIGINFTPDDSGDGRLIVAQDDAQSAPCITLKQADISEGFIDFEGSARGAITTSNTDSAESFRVELNGTTYRIALYADA